MSPGYLGWGYGVGVTGLNQEIEKLYGGKDSNTLNNEFIERNSNSVLHRAAGEYRMSGVGHRVGLGVTRLDQEIEKLYSGKKSQHTQQWVLREKW